MALTVTLCAWRVGPPVTYFEEPRAIVEAIAGIAGKVGTPVRVLNIQVSPETIVVRAQDPAKKSHINEWRVVRHHLGSLNWEAETGPEPYQPPLINPDLEENLFDLSEVDVASIETLVKEAVKQARLQDAPRVTSIEIARTLSILPEPASGPVRWSVTVGSGWETARITADAKGAIVAVDLTDTQRAKTFDLFKEPARLTDAAKAIREGVGSGPVLVKVTVDQQAVGIDTNLADPSYPVPLSGSLKPAACYTWGVNGLVKVIGRVDTSAVFGNPDAPFAVDDVDWSVLPKLLDAARGALGMPDGRFTEAQVTKPTNSVGAPKVLWRVEVEDANRERGKIFADVAGAIVRTEMPESRRVPVNWLDPKAFADALAIIGQELGQTGRLAEISVGNDTVRITAVDPRKPQELAQFILKDGQIERFGMASPFDTSAPPFTLSDLAGLTAERIRDLEARTAETLKLPLEKIVDVTLSRASLDPSPKGNVTVEIRAEEAPFGRSGRVNYEIDGSVIKAYLP
jgi:hypothetical protein